MIRLGICALFVAGLLARALAVTEAEQWREKMQPLTPLGYVVRRAAVPPVLDGKLDDPAWREAAWTSDFVDIEGAAKPRPRFRTRAKLLWDDTCLYIAAELEEPHVWGTLTAHDAVIFRDPDFEVFIDPDGDTHRYTEFEINALNTGWDLLLDRPYQDGGPARNEWELAGLKTAVHVDGTLNTPGDVDRGWSVEIAIPWRALAAHARHAGPPREGEQWRLNFSRVEWQITIENASYRKVSGRPEDNWVWSPQGVVDMHRPEMWGVLQFTARPPAEAVAVTPIPGRAARDLALELYYAQRDYWTAHGRWATSLDELGWNDRVRSAGVEAVELETTPDGYVAAVSFAEGGGAHCWRIRQDRLLKLDEPLPLATAEFVARATARFGAAGRRAAEFLVAGMPAGDRARLSEDFLLENLELAFAARTRFPWARAVPEEIFLDAVLPYASLDEARDPWRREFFVAAGELVRDCRTAGEAAQTLNRMLFNRVGVHYDLARRRNNQSPKESIEQGKATCTGLSILLVDACRAVGVPARVVGLPQWIAKEGNHTWVEIWDGEWRFCGADEYDARGLDHGWFVAEAAQNALSPDPRHQVYASTWRPTGVYFPLAWDASVRTVAAINLSARYAALGAAAAGDAPRVVHVRLRERAGGERVVAEVALCGEDGAVLARERTRAGRSDWNDLAALALPAGAERLRLRFTRDGETREAALTAKECAASSTLDYAWDALRPVR